MKERALGGCDRQRVDSRGIHGHPHQEECELFAKYVLPLLSTCRLNEVQQRRLPEPVTPLTTGNQR